MKKNTVYASKMNDRQFKIIDGVMMTRLPGQIWKRCGWPEPEMRTQDIVYYLSIGQMFEVE